MFKYILMPKLVAFYLKEFSLRKDGSTSDLYKWIFCMCLPFHFNFFRRARLNALMIAECTNSGEQIKKVLFALTGASLGIIAFAESYSTAYGSGNDAPDFAYDFVTGEGALVPYGFVSNAGILAISLNGASRNLVESYLPLLLPFYLDIQIQYL